MVLDSSDLAVFKVNTNAFALATAEAKDALEGQFTAQPQDSRGFFTWTHGSPTVAGAALAGDVGRAIYNPDTCRFYLISAVLPGVFYTISENYVGAAGSNPYLTLVFDCNSGVKPGQSGLVWGGEK